MLTELYERSFHFSLETITDRWTILKKKSMENCAAKNKEKEGGAKQFFSKKKEK